MIANRNPFLEPLDFNLTACSHGMGHGHRMRLVYCRLNVLHFSTVPGLHCVSLQIRESWHGNIENKEVFRLHTKLTTQMSRVQEQTEETEPEESANNLLKFEVEGIVPVIEPGDILPHFANKKRGKYVNHRGLSKEEALRLRREQNREAARRMRRKKAQQRAFLEEEIQRINAEITSNRDEDKQKELEQRLEKLEASRCGVIAVQNRSSRIKQEHRRVNFVLLFVIFACHRIMKRSLFMIQNEQRLDAENGDDDGTGCPPKKKQRLNRVIEPNRSQSGLNRVNFKPPPTLNIKHDGIRRNRLFTPLLVQQPFMRSPQIFNYHSPRSMQRQQWIISPFSSPFRAQYIQRPQIPPNINFLHRPFLKDVESKQSIKTEPQQEHAAIAEGVGVNNYHKADKDVKCEFCHKLLLCPDHLLKHRREEMGFQCPAMFADKKELKAHIRASHRNVLKNLESLFRVRF